MSDGTMKTRRFREAKRAEGAARQEIYLPAALCEAIDDFRDGQAISSRPEAIRRLLELGLKTGELLATVEGLRLLARMHAAVPSNSERTKRSRPAGDASSEAERIGTAGDNFFGD